MKGPFFSTPQHALEPGRVRHSKDAERLRPFARRADDGDRFGEEALVRCVGVQVEGGEEDALGGVGVDLASGRRGAKGESASG